MPMARRVFALVREPVSAVETEEDAVQTALSFALTAVS